MAQPRLRSTTGFAETSASDDSVDRFCDWRPRGRNIGNNDCRAPEIEVAHDCFDHVVPTGAAFDVAREQGVFAMTLIVRGIPPGLVNRQHRIPRKHVRRYSTHAGDSGGDLPPSHSTGTAGVREERRAVSAASGQVRSDVPPAPVARRE